MLTNLKDKLRKSIKSKKLNVFGLFFLLALMFLLITKLSKTYIETIELNITQSNVPEEHLLISNKDSIVKVVVKGYGFNLIPYFLFDHSFNVDFENDVRLKNNSYIWSSKENIQNINKQFKNTIEIISIKPDTLVFPFQSLAVKLVPVKANIAVNYALGYDIRDKIKIQPDSVRVIGSKDAVSKIDFVKTKKLTLKDINSDFRKTVVLDFKRSENMYISAKTVEISAKISKFTEGILEIPVTIVNVPANTNINYFPKVIAIAYYVNLNDFNKIKVADFKIECDYSEVANNDKSFLTPQLVKAPSQIKNTRLKQNKVEFILTQ